LYGVAGLIAEASELFVTQHAEMAQMANTDQGSRSAHVIERIGDLAVSPLDELVYRQISLMSASARIGKDAFDFFDDAAAKPLERDWM
jgi:hypothetical protein